MLTIGLTGGIGSGKTTVANIFSELGIPVYDTDIIARNLLESGNPAYDEVKITFGDSFFDEQNNLNREKLAELIFSDSEAKTKLESILHPHIKKQLINLINSCNAPYCIAVIPLLIEKNWQTIVDRILVVNATEKNQILRTTRRDNRPKEITKAIIRSQIDSTTRLNSADDIIDNNGTTEEVRNQVLALHEKYMRLALRSK
jgi:dephospho-CoA kinase